ncbi:DUF4296 domain-containing protein [Hymenobacter jeollabukensis]|uniref:DUF4296 domain-containing protein n=1 Tax=Hymenobacter jeollabukensis TaxID=2025313 RepID=A0A5R8WKH0_9BACT|nr:DUF4296 domain-containing protein [Hymenobacter jeollabukensis]TLM89065.1 DUF4296 domain-containing protein [Hymenobacter jeollabukensis]
MKNLLRTALLALAPVLLSQCDRPEEQVPPVKLLPREQMVSLLVDMHITEARVEASRLPHDSARVLFREQAKAVYWRHETDEATFRENMRYYATHGKDLEEIYATVVDSIQARQNGGTPVKQW